MITITFGFGYVVDFLLSIKTIVDELTILGVLLSDADLLLYSIRGLGLAYKEVIVAFHIINSVVPFEELYDKFVDNETFLRHVETQNYNQTSTTVNLS